MTYKELDKEFAKLKGISHPAEMHKSFDFINKIKTDYSGLNLFSETSKYTRKILELLDHKEEVFRYYLVLGLTGWPIEEARWGLLKAISDPSPKIRSYATLSLWSDDSQSMDRVAPVLVELATNESDGSGLAVVAFTQTPKWRYSLIGEHNYNELSSHFRNDIIPSLLREYAQETARKARNTHVSRQEASNFCKNYGKAYFSAISLYGIFPDMGVLLSLILRENSGINENWFVPIRETTSDPMNSLLGLVMATGGVDDQLKQTAKTILDRFNISITQQILDIIAKSHQKIEKGLVFDCSDLSVLVETSAKDEPDTDFKSLIDSITDESTYEQISSQLSNINNRFRLELARKLEPAFNRHIREMPYSTQAEKKTLGDWVNNELERFGLAVECPNTKLPAKLKGIPGHWTGVGRFTFEMYVDGKRERPAYSDTLPELKLIDATPTKELSSGFQGRLAAKSKRSDRSPGE